MMHWTMLDDFDYLAQKDEEKVKNKNKCFLFFFTQNSVFLVIFSTFLHFVELFFLIWGYDGSEI